MANTPSDFYLVVALDELKEKAPILFVSPDLQSCDPNLETDALDDASLDTGWVKNAAPGLYKLTLRGWSDQNYEGEWDGGWAVQDAKLLVAFPPYGATEVA